MTFFPGKSTVSASTIVLFLLGVLVFLILITATGPSVHATGKCGRLSRVAGQSILTNTCGQCRSIQLVKDRAGNALPNLRTFRLNAGEQFPLPFKGPGAVRITNDADCRDVSLAEEKEQHDIADALRRCVRPVRTSRGMVLANGCDACRSVIIGRRYADGREVHKSYLLDSKGILELAGEGAISAEIIHDELCRP